MKAKKYLLLFIKIIIPILLLCIVFFFIFRNTILEKAISKAKNKCKANYDCILDIEQAKFEGFSTIAINTLSLKPKKADTLFYSKKIEVEVSLWQLFFGNIQLNSLKVNEAFIQLIKNEKGKNFQGFLQSKNKQKNASVKTIDYADFAHTILSKVLYLVPTEMEIKKLTIVLQDFEKKGVFFTENITLRDKQLLAKVKVNYNDFNQIWNFSGEVNPRDRTADIAFFSNNQAVKIPYIDKRYGLVASFDTLYFQLEDYDKQRTELHLLGKTKVKNLRFYHQKISKNTSTLSKAGIDYHLVFGERFIAIDSSSLVTINQFKFKPYLQFQKDKTKKIAVAFTIPKTKVQDFITALPQGMFNKIKGIKATGEFQYKLFSEYDEKQIDSLVFESNIVAKNIKVIQSDSIDFALLNRDFIYRAIDKGVLQRPILISTTNPNYARLQDISPALIQQVLKNEDPTFYSHNGFVAEAFKLSIIKNIKTKKFSRGASTISMQLVKNVFLNREKTLARKIEEILIVYLLEQQKITPKSRMLEVYFNIIEWGPNVYGIGEAARFYFEKAPYELDDKESYFLAKIIPSPKKFMYKAYGIPITGRASSFLPKQVQDTIPVLDSLQFEEEEIDF